MIGLTRNWGLVALRGLAAVLFGLATLVVPGISLVFLIALYGAYAFIDGLIAIGTSIQMARHQQAWGALLFGGLVSLAAGVIAFVYPGITALALLYLIAAWAIVTGVLQLVAAVKLRKMINNELLLGLAGLASVAFGGLLVFQPAAGVLAVLWLIGSYAIVFGGLLIALGFRLRGLHQRVDGFLQGTETAQARM